MTPFAPSCVRYMTISQTEKLCIYYVSLLFNLNADKALNQVPKILNIMKKLHLLILVFLAFGLTASAQKKSVPAKVKSSFEQHFKEVEDLKWRKEKDGNWEAEFEQKEVEKSATFSKSGQLLETETEIKVTELPDAVKKALAGKKVKEAARIEKVDSSVVYEAEVRRHNLLFDVSGNRLSDK